MIRRPPRSTQSRSSAASDVYKRQRLGALLGLARDEVDLLQWSHPRPVMLGAIPTAVRRLSSNWRWHGAVGQDLQARHPLPDYVPATLFSDLSLPELSVEVPRGRKH